MNPISNQEFSHDAVKFVYQYPDVVVPKGPPPIKPFKIKSPQKSKKTKKDIEKGKKQQDAKE